MTTKGLSAINIYTSPKGLSANIISTSPKGTNVNSRRCNLRNRDPNTANPEGVERAFVCSGLHCSTPSGSQTMWTFPVGFTHGYSCCSPPGKMEIETFPVGFSCCSLPGKRKIE